MSKKATLSQLSKTNALLNKPDKEIISNKKDKVELEANVARGQRSDFLRVTITLPIDLLQALRDLGIKRKRIGAKDTDVSSLLREAAVMLLNEEK